MITDVSQAPLVILAFLGACLAVFAGFTWVAVAAIAGHRDRARLGLILLGVFVGIYAGILLGASAFSKEYVLGRGVEKYFCEADCHLAYSITGVTRNGDQLLVTLRTRFDETTTSPRRPKEVPLTPNPRELWVLDANGTRYAPLPAMTGTPLDQPLKPGESYETHIAFAVPPGARDLRLWLRNAAWPNAFLITHENSPLHGHVLFDLKEDARDKSAASR
ncbi:MAG: hypothetical protein HYX26_00770 [Acidobacteriales bacterium]|nr:hypothetical protein [Terriglobales bacterium]